jgi:coenzyme F420-0:L-glutamate ligase/coenzyme F420-1:gamma-L-glutamate ligase
VSDLRLEAFGVGGIGEVRAGDDVAALVAAGLAAAGEELRDGDVVVVSSKVVSKAEGRHMAADATTDREAAVTSQTVRVVAERVTPRGLTRVVESRSGPVLAAAGVDASNVVPGTVLLLPADPDASARALRARLGELTGARVGVVVSDTAGRAWRDGQVDIAIGAAGVAVAEDLRGAHDEHGRLLEVTVRALADEVASLGDLVKGKLAGVPVAVVRGLEALVADEDGPGASALLRSGGEDWFRHGHVEAVRAALGVPPVVEPIAGKDPAPVSVPPAAVAERLRRALDVALASPDPVAGGDGYAAAVEVSHDVTTDGEVVGFTLTLPAWNAVSPRPADPAARAAALIRVGALLQRITAAGWTEDLAVRATLAPRAAEGDGPPAIRVVASPRQESAR